MPVDAPITSSDLAFARDGEKPTEEGYRSESAQVTDWMIQDNQVSEEEHVIFKLVDNTKQGGVHIHGIDDVVNPRTKAVERIRCLSGIESIWLKDQKDLTPQYIKDNQRTFSFPRGAKILRVPKSDKAGLEFLSLTRHNIGAPNRKTGSRFEFFEYNPAKQQEEALKKEMLEIEMAIEASKIEVEPMRKHANYLGIAAFDDFGIPKTDEGIRREYIVAAKRNPAKFKKTLNSKEVEVSYLIRKAIGENLIDLGGHGGSVTWGAGGFIGKVPIGRNTHEYLVELALTNSEDGKRFLSRLNEVATKK
jgi:hypothetical protein